MILILFMKSMMMRISKEGEEKRSKRRRKRE